MEDTGLFFWLIVFAVAVLQGIGQKKKKPGQRGRRPSGANLPRRPSGRPVEPSDRELAGLPEPSPAASTEAAGEEDAEGSSEGMIPQDVWAEILGLARGEPRAKQESQPIDDLEDEDLEMDEPLGAQGPDESDLPERRSRESRPPERRPREVRPRDVARRPLPPVAPASRAVPVSHTAQASLHTTSSGDYRSRLGLEDEQADGVHDADSASGQPGARAQLFGDGSLGELRKAVILQEVLGPPVGLKE